MAARVAAQLRKTPGVQIETVKGNFGEFSVSVDGRNLINTARFWYPWPGKVIQKLRAAMAARPQSAQPTS
jgi:hypothetical protein